MKTAMQMTLVMFAALIVTGCGITGKWSLESVNPTADRRDFEYQSLTLQKDGTFYAESLEPHQGIETTSGTYTYKNGTLALVAHDGEEHTYQAQLEDAGKKLQLVQTGRERKIKATFMRRQ
jgi:hypothetical protein